MYKRPRKSVRFREVSGLERCLAYTCSFLNSGTSISGPKSNFVIRHNFTCTSSNIIYCISCIKCCKLYIGETGRRLSDRIVLRTLWLVSYRVYIRLCKHGCHVTPCFSVLFYRRNRKWTPCVYTTCWKHVMERESLIELESTYMYTLAPTARVHINF